MYILKSSCAKLLAAKYTMGTQSRVFAKFGPHLAVPSTKSNKIDKKIMLIHPNYKITLKFLINPTPIIKALYGSKSIATLDNLVCNICGSTYRVEMHHIRALKDLNPKLSKVDKLMAGRKRKQLPLCRECHMKKHNKLL